MIMQKGRLFILVGFSIIVLQMVAVSSAIEGGGPGEKVRMFAGHDLHLAGGKLISYQPSTGEHTLVFPEGFSMLMRANKYSSNEAVVWLKAKTTEYRGRVRVDYDATVYLAGGVSVEKTKNAQIVDLSETVVEEGEAMVVRFSVSGEVFVTADRREIADPRALELYKKAVEVVEPAERKFVIEKKAAVPELPAKEKEAAKPVKKKAAAKPIKKGEVVTGPEVKFRYPVNIAPAGEIKPKIEWDEQGEIATIIGRFYVWQRRIVEEKELLLELQADNAVVWRSGRKPVVDKKQGERDVLAGRDVRAIYLCGDVVMTEGQRTIRAAEMYYDFEQNKGLAVEAVMRNFDVGRGIPIYVRAAKLRQMAENKFAAENATVTSSEFYQPQISLAVSSVIITDTTTVDAEAGRLGDSSFDVEMRDVQLKMYDKTIFYWPYMRSNLERPDVPLKSVHAGYDNTWGASVETRWYLARLLGLQEAEGTDSTLALDYYGKRGFGGGAEIEYARENYFGRLLGYVIHDTGKDRLGRHRSRRNVEPERELRGRFRWQHKHFLPYNWQLTTEVSYASDEHFIEGYYRSEYNVGKEQETLVHLKRIEDNWGLSIVGKARINDFVDKLEEMPSAEFHLTGQSLFDDRFTLYSDTEGGRLRQRISDKYPVAISDEWFSFVSHRSELDMPMRAGAFKVVPFVAGTFGYDDRSGFTRTLVDGSSSGEFGESDVWLGEAGIRVGTQYWKVYPDVKSRLWDLEGLRHIIKPQLTAVVYEGSDKVIEQRDTLNIGIFQRLQTKRGPADNKRTVDWMRLDVDVTLVDDPEAAHNSGADRFVWNKPFVPLGVLSAPGILNSSLGGGFRRFEMYGPRRDYLGADYMWRISDTSAILGDINFDIRSGVVQQLDIGLAQMRWPNFQFYIGSRYLRRVEALGEKGTNAFTFAATYILDPRYTLVFSQQFDFDYGANMRSDIALIRRYHRVYCGITYSADESLDRQAIVFSIWPQGIPELAIGPRRYMEIRH